MEGLSIEQKAKRFDEALAMAKECITYIPDDAVKKYMLNIFPELKELGDEEEVRKAMIDFFKHEREEGVTVLHYGVNIERMIAWLEKQGDFKSSKWTEGDVIRHGGILALVTNGRKAMKSNCEQITIQYPDEWIKTGTKERKYFFEELEKQGEQNLIMAKSPQLGEPKPTDKVEPKFKVGDWISGYYTNYKVLSLNNDGYVVEDVDGDKINILFENEKFHHLFTIADAKDGDVLCYKDEISLYKHDIKNCTKQEPTFGGFVYHCCYDGKRFITDSLYSLTEKDKKDIYPATKEQRDTLERAMADAGYIFDFESKELKKLGQSEVTKMSDQEEIAEIPFGAKDSELQEAIYYVPKGFHAEIDDDKVVIKKGEKLTAWTEEDNMMIEETLYFLREYQHSNRCKDENGMQNSVTCEEWLKSLKDRVGCEANCTTTKEWNESDKEEFQIAIDTLVEAGQHDSAHWLKSLKQRIGVMN